LSTVQTKYFSTLDIALTVFKLQPQSKNLAQMLNATLGEQVCAL